jgi:tetratricopeptide (TPR) repeat protein
MLTELATTPIALTLRRLSADRQSGDLQVRSGKIVKTVFFDHGRLVFAASNLKKDRLGEALVALGRISDEEFNRVSALMKGDRKRRFGEALVTSGVMDKNEVGGSVARQVRRIVLSLFELSDGAAVFEERRCAIPLEYMVSLSLHRLLYDGIRTMESRELILTGLGNLDRSLVLASVPPFPFDLKECPPEEKEILELARRPMTQRRLAWASGGLALSRLQAVYALSAAGILQDADEALAAASQPIVQMETGTFLLSALRRSPDPSGLDAIRLEVEDELERSAHLDKEKWLKVASSAPREELVKALEEKMERYHALREAVGEEEQIKTDIEVILGRASAMLRLARQAALPAPSPPEERPTPPEARAPEARAARHATESAGAPGSTTFEGQAKVEHLLMEGEVRMTVSDYANAVTVYEKLVQIAPMIPAYRVRLAIAMACYPRTAKQAEREFLEALRLDADNADIHYQFGRYYKAMKQRSRAVAEMRTAVRLNPRHEMAREELASLSPKDSALTSLKKLFK